MILIIFFIFTPVELGLLRFPVIEVLNLADWHHFHLLDVTVIDVALSQGASHL